MRTRRGGAAHPGGLQHPVSEVPAHPSGAGSRPHVRRERLRAALDEHGWRVAVVRARAGSGKTEALRDWARDRPDVVHVVLEQQHDGPMRFTDALSRALSASAKVAHDELVRPPGAAAQAHEVIYSLLDRVTRPSVLVLDAVENVGDPWVLDALDALTRTSTERHRLVLCGRRIPRLTALAIMRVRDEVADVVDADLRLDDDEASALYEVIVGAPPAPPVLSALLDFTEGWVAAFRLAARQWQSPRNRTIAEHLEAAVPSIRDYLLGDVLARLRSPLVEFLVDTSILHRLATPLCDAVRDASDSAQILRELEHETAFLEPAPGEPGAARLHGLLHRVLLDELTTSDPHRCRELHRRAARWFHATGSAIEAMQHTVEAGDLDDAWRTFEAHWLDRLLAGDVLTVLGWTRILARQPQLDVARASQLAIALLILRRPTQAEHFVIKATFLHETGDEEHAPMLEVARCLHAVSRGSFGVAIAHADAARHGLGEPHAAVWRRLRMSVMLSYVLSFADRLGNARAELESALRDEDPTSPLDAVVFPTARASFALTDSRMAEAEDFADRAIEAGRALPRAARAVLCEAHYIKAFVALERNDLDTAELHFNRCIASGEALAYAHVRVLVRLGLARLQHARGQRDAAFALVAECRRLPHTRLDGYLLERITEVEAHLRLCEDEPVTVLATLPPNRGPRLRLVEARALAMLGEHAAALDILDDADPPGARRAVQVAFLRARCAPDVLTARRHVVAGLELAERHSFVRMVLDERAWMLEHLFALVATWPTDFVSRLVDWSLHELTVRAPITPLSKLSERELEVWRYLATPLSLGEISRRLYISRNTMKTHVRNIYRKLGVTAREAAVAVRLQEGAPTTERLLDAKPGGNGPREAGRGSQ